MNNGQKGAKVFKVELGVGKVVRNKLVRKGRGFSRLELKEVGVSLPEARSFGIPVDERRKSVHDFNLSYLKELLEEERAYATKTELEKGIVEDQYKELMQVRGIGLASAQMLVEMDITSVEELADLEVDKLSEMEIPTNTLRRWIKNAKKYLGEEIEEEEEEEKEEKLEEKELEEPEKIEEEVLEAFEEVEEKELEVLKEEELKKEKKAKMTKKGKKAKKEELEEEELEKIEAELDKLEDADLEGLEEEDEDIDALLLDEDKDVKE